jgi:hypothetical protein
MIMTRKNIILMVGQQVQVVVSEQDSAGADGMRENKGKRKHPNS